MLIPVLTFAGFGLFWFVMLFLIVLFSTTEGTSKNTLLINYVTFIGGPLLLLLCYKMYGITKYDLSWSAELFRFIVIIVVPLILAKLFIMFGDRL